MKRTNLTGDGDDEKSINEIFRECAKADGMCTCMYARIAEANYLMDDVKQYPVLLRQFNETISETKLSVTRRRTTTLYFCDALGKAEPDTRPRCSLLSKKWKNGHSHLSIGYGQWASK